MSEDPPKRPPLAAMAEVLRVRRNAIAGLIVGGLLALATYLVRVLELLGPFQGTRAFPVLGVSGWYLMLAFVLAVTTAMLVAALLTLGSAIRLVRRAPDE